MTHVPARQTTPDEEVERYLAEERTASALRLVRTGALALILGGAGTLLLYRWWIEGGVVPRLVLASPFALVGGVVLTLYGLAGLVRARR